MTSSDDDIVGDTEDPMNFLKFTVLLALTVTIATGAGFTAQADCYTTSRPSGGILTENHGSLACQAGQVPPPGYFASNGYSLVDNKVFATDASLGVDFFELTVDKLMVACSGECTAQRPQRDNGSFRSLIEYQQTLTTLGVQRMGVISYFLNPGACCVNIDALNYEEWFIGEYSGKNNGGRGGGQALVGYGYFVLPFQLGSAFDVSMKSNAFPLSGAGQIYGISRLSFSIYEADGSTPVTIFAVAVPEPSTFLLTGVLLLACVRLRTKAFCAAIGKEA
jgi:hypothetical protein